MTLQHALFQSLMKSQNPFSRMDSFCTQYELLEKKKKGINVGERQESVVLQSASLDSDLSLKKQC